VDVSAERLPASPHANQRYDGRRETGPAELVEQEKPFMIAWIFEPRHTAAEFRARHMMVTWVRGHFKNVHGRMEFDPDKPELGSVQAEITAGELWTGEPDRDAHLKSADFLDVANHPKIIFRSTRVERSGAHHYRVAGELTIRGVTRSVTLAVDYLGHWQTSYWENGVDKGPVTRAGFVATATINRHDFGVIGNAPLEHNGSVVGSEVGIEIDVEAIREKDLKKD
jgi:polyisoprenoid-binding protein YceI